MASSVPRRSPFAILGVSRDASAAQVKRAYRRLCAQYHPDVQSTRTSLGSGMESAMGALYPTDPRADEGMPFLEIQQAYRTLKDRYARAQWEREEQDWEWQQHYNARGGGFGPALMAVRDTSQAPGTARVRISEIIATLPLRLGDAFTRDRYRLWLALGACVLSALLIHLSGARRDSPESIARLHGEPNAPQQAQERTKPGSAWPAVHVEKPSVVETIAPLRSTRGKPSVLDDDLSTRKASRGPRGHPSEDARVSSLAISTSFEAPSVFDLADGLSAALPSADLGPAPADAAVSAIPHDPAAAPAAIGAWQGRWVASCTVDRGADLYRGSLEIADRARFRWASLATGVSGSVDHLELDSSGTGSEMTPLRLLRANGDSPGSGRTVATLERRASSGRSMTWHTHSLGAANPESAAPCTHWQIFADDGAPGIDGLWVLPSDEKSLEGRFTPEYVELRIARYLSGYKGQFAGRYQVPVTSMASEMRFQFHAPSTAKGWHSWENADGVAGEVLLAPLGRSRLAVLWRRGSISSGRPQLSGGVAVLRRME